MACTNTRASRLLSLLPRPIKATSSIANEHHLLLLKFHVALEEKMWDESNPGTATLDDAGGARLGAYVAPLYGAYSTESCTIKSAIR